MTAIVVQNVPGYGGLTLADQIYDIVPRDGSVVALANNGMPTAPGLTPPFRSDLWEAPDDRQSAGIDSTCCYCPWNFR